MMAKGALSAAAQCLVLLLLFALSACGRVAPPLEPSAPSPSPGIWSLEYRGGCSGREAERLQISQFDETAIVFEDFRLLRDDSGAYQGGVNRSAPMPVDGREIGYTITFRLTAADAGGFTGTETVIEGGGHGLDCPVELRYLGEE